MGEKKIDYLLYIKSIMKKHGISDEGYYTSLSELLVSHGWIEKEIYCEDGRLYTSEDFIMKNGNLFEMHAQYYQLSALDKSRILFGRLKSFAPKTAVLFDRYTKENRLEDETVYTLLDFLDYYLPGELHESTDREICTLMENGFDSLSKVYGDILADYINWTKARIKTIYFNTYFMKPYSDRGSESSAYSESQFLMLIYYLFNEEYILGNSMYSRAAQSKNCVDTWLFLALHCICALRNTDLINLPHPRLPIPASDVLTQVENGTFSEADAKACLYSIIFRLDVTKNVPNKTRSFSGVPDIKLTVPHSIETHMGTLFAVAEAHCQMHGVSPEKPLIRVITEYRKIQRYMGDDIGDLFIEADFRSRSANKSFMQLIYIMTDQVNDASEDDFRVKGYILAALARSHKGGYAQFAETTSIYLKDAKMSGYTPEFVARELMERGVLSCLADMLLKMICGDSYEKLSIENQTKAIKALNFSPLDVENVVGIMKKAKLQSTAIAKQIYDCNSRDTVLRILHKLGNGEAVSKQNDCLCLVTAMGRPCTYEDRYHSCVGCEYEISTKATVFTLMAEYKRLLAEYTTSKDPKAKAKSRALAQQIIIPAISEIIDVMKEKYGEESIVELKEIIGKVTK